MFQQQHVPQKGPGTQQNLKKAAAVALFRKNIKRGYHVSLANLIQFHQCFSFINQASYPYHVGCHTQQ